MFNFFKEIYKKIKKLHKNVPETLITEFIDMRKIGKSLTRNQLNKMKLYIYFLTWKDVQGILSEKVLYTM